MTKKVKTIKTGLALEPQSEDPSNPKEGQLQISDGTHREAGLWLYENGAWKEASVDSFLDFPDTPSTYTGNANKFLKVNIAEDAVEYTEVSSNYDEGSYTPGSQGFGTLGSADASFIQIGKMVHIQGKITTGTPSGNEARINLPAGKTVKTGQTVRVVGHATVTGVNSPYQAMLNVLATGGDTYLNFTFSDGGVGGDPLTPALGSFIADDAVEISFTAFVEVDEALSSNLSGGFVNSLLNLSDTPIDYTGQAGKTLLVNDTEDGMEFGNAGSGETVTFRSAIQEYGVGQPLELDVPKGANYLSAPFTASGNKRLIPNTSLHTGSALPSWVSRNVDSITIKEDGIYRVRAVAHSAGVGYNRLFIGYDTGTPTNFPAYGTYSWGPWKFTQPGGSVLEKVEHEVVFNATEIRSGLGGNMNLIICHPCEFGIDTYPSATFAPEVDTIELDTSQLDLRYPVFEVMITKLL